MNEAWRRHCGNFPPGRDDSREYRQREAARLVDLNAFQGSTFKHRNLPKIFKIIEAITAAD
jgi:hypothetical protein